MSQQLKRRSDLHIARKVWHTCGVLAIVVFYHNLSRTSAIQLFTLVGSIFVIGDFLRQQLPVFNRFTIAIMHPFMRESERNSLAGSTYMVIGVFLILVLFPKNIVVLTLFFLAVADPLASYVGILHGRDKLIGKKSLQGSFAAFLACTLIAALFYYSRGLMMERLLIVSILSGLIGAIAELIPIGKLDDNLTFPIIAAPLLWLVFFVFGGF